MLQDLEERQKCVDSGQAPGRPPIITDTMWVIWDANTERLW